MRIAKGPRPWTIHLFGATILSAALLRLLLGLSGEPNLLNWYFGTGSDPSIIAHFTEFTIALFPILWVYWMGSRTARYVVLVFALFRLAGFVFGFEGELSLVMIEPLCILVGIGAMLSDPSSAWIEGWEDQRGTFR